MSNAGSSGLVNDTPSSTAPGLKSSLRTTPTCPRRAIAQISGSRSRRAGAPCPAGPRATRAGERQDRECEHEALDLPPYLVDGVLVRDFLVSQALHGRTGLEFHAAVHLDGSTTRDLYSVQHLRIAGYHCGVRVEPVGGGAHYDHVNGLFHKIKARDLRRVGSVTMETLSPSILKKGVP